MGTAQKSRKHIECRNEYPVGTTTIEIPPMTNERRQPQRDAILIDGKHALMTQATFNELMDYSRSKPSGVYPGKMWKHHGDVWYFRWYGENDGHPDGLPTYALPILIV